MKELKDLKSYSKITKDNPKDKIEVEIGDTKDLTKFQPQFKLMRWDNEVNFSARLKDDIDEVETFSEKDEKVTWTKGKRKAELYNIAPNEEHEEGAFEFEITLDEKPLTNKVEFSIETKGIDFFYQPEVTDDEAKSLADIKEISLTEAKRKIRPENVINSYAIYTSDKKYNIKNGKEYKVGKLGHIYRPKIVDSKGIEVWGELNIDTEKKELVVTIPQGFLDKAVYPVRHAAGLTIGYTSIGGSTALVHDEGSSEAYYVPRANQYSFGSSDVSSISAYYSVVGNGSESMKGKAAIYDDSSDVPNDLLGDTVLSSSLSGGSSSWKTMSITLNVSSGNNWLAVVPGTSTYYGVDLYIAYDTSPAGDGYTATGYTYPATTPDPFPSGSTDLYSYSIYATYTAAATGTKPKINIGDSWKQSTAMKINIGDSWKVVAAVKQNIGDTWKDVF